MALVISGDEFGDGIAAVIMNFKVSALLLQCTLLAVIFLMMCSSVL